MFLCEREQSVRCDDLWCVCVPSELEGNERWLLTLLQGLSRFTPCHTIPFYLITP